MPRKGQTTDVMERLKARTVINGNCWIWIGKLVGDGYGSIWYDNKNIRIPRLVCHLFHGADLYDLSWTANHRIECEQKACWNPDHIYVGTQYQNVQDSIRKGTFHDGRENLNGRSNFDKENYMKKRNS